MKFLKPLSSFLFLLPLHYNLLAQPFFSHYDTLRGALTPLRECYDVTFYKLNLNIDIDRRKISGYNQIHYLVKKDFNTLQVDLYTEMKISTIEQHGKQLSFQRDSNAVFVKFSEVQTENTRNYITIHYSGIPQVARTPPWNGGVVWSTDSLLRPWIGIACESDGASLWWPCKDHPSDEPDSMSMTFSIPNELTCISNGNLRHKYTSAGINSFEWFVQYPINIYNVTFNIGHYAHFSDIYKYKSGEGLPLDYYVLDYNLEKAKNHFEMVKPMLACYDKLFGKYPFFRDGYALIETPYWGMEHQSAIAYGNHYRTDMLDFDYIIVHESAHEWWGNSLSAKDHAELWIHESFATYSEALLVECYYNYEYYLRYLNLQKKNIENKEPILGPLNVNYHVWRDSDIYYKGSWMLHTLRNVIGNDSLWFQIIFGLANDFKISSVSTEDIINYINKKTDQDYHYFFDQYLKHTQPPKFLYSLQKKGRHTLLTYKWESDVKEFKMPIFVLINKDQVLKLSPSTDFQTYKYIGEADSFRIPEEYFYIETEKINPK
jgi:aminopeptidase N